MVSTVYNGGFRISAPVQRAAGAPGSSTLALLHSKAASRVLPLVISGREYAARQTPQDVHLALQAAAAAIHVDPDYVPAWVAIAELHVLEASCYLRSSLEAGQLALQAADKALAINNQCGPAVAVRGWVRALIFGALADGLQDLDMALEMDADYALTSVLRAGALQALGRHADAIEAARRAQHLNGFSHTVQAVLPLNLVYGGQPHAALESAQKLALSFPGVHSVHEVLSIVCSALDRHDDALMHAQCAHGLAPHSLSTQVQVAYALARLQRVAEAGAILEKIDGFGPLAPCAWMAVVYSALGDGAMAVKQLQQARLRHEPHFFAVRDDPRLAVLRDAGALDALWK